jgi:hypothetical protein
MASSIVAPTRVRFGRAEAHRVANPSVRSCSPSLPRRYRPGAARWTVAGFGLALALHVVAGWGALPGRAQSNTTTTVSSTTETGFESPPACSVIGSTREVQTLTFTVNVGPACIGIGNRDAPNPSPACGGLPPAPPPMDPSFGGPFLVPLGTVNTNTNVHTLMLTCVAPTPALPWPWLIGLGAGLLGAGAGLVRRRRL